MLFHDDEGVFESLKKKPKSLKKNQGKYYAIFKCRIFLIENVKKLFFLCGRDIGI